MTQRYLLAMFVALLSMGLACITPTARAQSGPVIASDSFDRADEVPLVVGGNWGRVVAGFFDGRSQLVGNQVRNGSNEGIYYWTGAGTFDPTRQYASERVVQKNGEIGLVLLGGPDQAIMVGWGPPGVGNTVYIYWYSGGQDRGQLATGPSTVNNGDIIEAVLENGVIYAKVNGVTVKSVANTTTLTSGNPGFITYGDVNQPAQVGILDDWQAGTPQSYTISGTITENAAGLAGALVTASGGFSGTATTNASGAYSLTGVRANATGIVLTPTRAGHLMSPTSLTVAGPVTDDVTGQDFTSTPNTNAVLTVQASNGTVTRSPNATSYAFGTVVTLTPVPDVGYTFSGWSGDVPAGHESDNPLLLTMDQDRTVVAGFVPPGLVASDDFNRANETPLAVGPRWQQPLGGGTANLAGNQLSGAAGEALYYWQGPGTFDDTHQFARARVSQAGGQLGLVLLGAPGQALVTAWNAGTLYIYWYMGGTYQGNLSTTASSVQVADVVEAALEGGVVYARLNGVVVASVLNSTSLTSGRPGFETFQSGGGLDDWQAGTPTIFSISGTITENAVGLAGVQVTASGGFIGTTTTSASGTFTFTGVPSNATSIVLTPTLPGHTMSPLARTIAGPMTGDATGQDFTSTLNPDAFLTIVTEHGTVAKSPDQPSYALGTIVTLTPTASPGYVFSGWSGDVPAGHAGDNPLQVTMDHDRTITAVFVLPSLTASDDFNRADETPLTVGGNWHAVFATGSAHLADQRVAGVSGEALYTWQGPGSFQNDRQFARMRVVQATGQLGLLLLGAPGQALVTAWNTGTLYIYWYEAGVYRGNLSTSASTVQPGDMIEAVLDTGVVSAKINGVVVASVPNTTTLASGRPGFETFLAGGILDDWESGTSPSLVARTLTVNIVGGGTVAKSPEQPAYAQGSTVQLTATPSAGWAFSAWSDSLVGESNPANLLMDADKTVTARFVDVAAPLVQATSPNGAELLLAGTHANVTWSASDNDAVASVDLELSRSGPAGPFEVVATGLTNSGTYDWLVPGPASTTAFVRVTARDAAGNTAQDLSDAAFTIAPVAGVNDGTPVAFALSPVWPNPVRHATRFQFALPRAAAVHVGLHDVQGRELQVLADGAYAAGRHTVEWTNAAGAALQPGLYFVRLAVPGHTQVQRFALIR